MEYFLLAVCIIIIVLPCRYDPAIRFRERIEKRRNRPEIDPK